MSSCKCPSRCKLIRSTVYSTILKDQYGLNELQIGLCYL